MSRPEEKGITPVRTPSAGTGTAILLALLAVLGGCTLGPDFIRPQTEVNDYWSTKGNPRVATETSVDRQWWSAFNDPALDQLISIASQENLPLQIAALRIMEARARLGTDGAIEAVYRLNRDWVEVGPGDFMWLRAFCPQACYAGGPGRFRYLLYKDVNRHAPLWFGTHGSGRAGG